MVTNYIEKEINGKTYRIGKLPAMQQFHVSRRLAPVLFALGGSAVEALKARGAQEVPDTVEDGAEESAAQFSETLLLTIKPLMDAVAQLSDADTEYVVYQCLSVCFRKEGEKNFARVYIPNSGLAFEDISMQDMIRLTVEVIRKDLGNFFSALQQG